MKQKCPQGASPKKEVGWGEGWSTHLQKLYIIYFVFRYCMYMNMKVTVWRQIMQITFAGNQEKSYTSDE